MKHLLDVLCLSVIQALDTFDRWLCLNLHWSIRPWWCALWLRRDEFHPSLEWDYDALKRRMDLYRKLMLVWFDVTRLRPTPTKNERDEEAQKISEIIKASRAKYFCSVSKRRIASTLAYRKTPSLL